MNEKEQKKAASDGAKRGKPFRRPAKTQASPEKTDAALEKTPAVKKESRAPHGARPEGTKKEAAAHKSRVLLGEEHPFLSFHGGEASEKTKPVFGKSGKKAAKTPDKARGRGGKVTPLGANENNNTRAANTQGTLPAFTESAPADRKKKGKKSREAGKANPEIRGKLRVMMLGGLQEIGKNLTVIEYNEDILMVDCGVAFPDEEMPGVDLVVPDVTYLEKKADRIRGLVITHGHEDHIGGIPYILQKINPPIYATRLTIGILSHKLKEHRLPEKPSLSTVEAGDVIKLGPFSVEFIHANHSIADACCLAIRTPAGLIFHTGDFKIDVSPIDGQMMDLTRIGEIGREGVLLLLGESTNAERPGFTPSERKVGGSLETVFREHEESRIIIATFSSNVHRVQQIIDASVRHKRKVAVLGRSMETVTEAAVDLGYMNLPAGTLIPATEISRFKPSEITLITTGSQGEPMSALYRMAFDEHDKVHLSPSDVVVLSSSAIPGNEKLVGKIINALIRSGIRVINDSVADVHVSGHACQEELKMIHALLRPRYFMPIHGEYRHLFAHKEIAEFMGTPKENIFISEIGKVLEIDARGARFAGSVPAGKVLVDGSGVGDVGNIVLRDRKHLSQDGLIVVVAVVDMQDGTVISGPDIVSRGFVYVREAEELMDSVRHVAKNALEAAMRRRSYDWMELKSEVRDQIGRFLFNKTRKKPMILPVIMNM